MYEPPDDIWEVNLRLRLAGRLVARLQAERIGLDPAHLGKLKEWFAERVEKQETTRRDFALEVKSGSTR